MFPIVFKEKYIHNRYFLAQSTNRDNSVCTVRDVELKNYCTVQWCYSPSCLQKLTLLSTSDWIGEVCICIFTECTVLLHWLHFLDLVMYNAHSLPVSFTPIWTVNRSFKMFPKCFSACWWNRSWSASIVHRWSDSLHLFNISSIRCPLHF